MNNMGKIVTAMALGLFAFAIATSWSDIVRYQRIRSM